LVAIFGVVVYHEALIVAIIGTSGLAKIVALIIVKTIATVRAVVIGNAVPIAGLIASWLAVIITKSAVIILGVHIGNLWSIGTFAGRRPSLLALFFGFVGSEIYSC